MGKSACSPYRGSRCGECYWALYDGDWCMNNSCKLHGKSVGDNRVHLNNEEAQILIQANAQDEEPASAGFSPSPCCGRFEAAKHSLQFQCDWAVYSKNSGSSLCYVTSHKRADFFAKCLNRLDELGELEGILHANAEDKGTNETH